MSDDDDGITLPGTTNATHNIYLAPFYVNRLGQNYNLIVSWIPGISYRGTDGYLWSSSASGNSSTYRFYTTNSKVSLGVGIVRIRAISLRCLVSTNNRLMDKVVNATLYFLVSDDDSLVYANMGVTLPYGKNATYNGGLSPMFITRGASVDPSIKNDSFGETGTFWTANTGGMWDQPIAFVLQLESASVYPLLRGYYTHGFPLRCLVSTNNR